MSSATANSVRSASRTTSKRALVATTPTAPAPTQVIPSLAAADQRFYERASIRRILGSSTMQVLDLK